MSVNVYNCKFKLYIDHIEFKVYTFFMVIHNVSENLDIIKCNGEFYSKIQYTRKEINFFKNCTIPETY